MPDADFLNSFFVPAREFIQIAIDAGKVKVFVVIVLQVLHCGCFAGRIREAALNQFALYRGA
jgi:hypothetical protein